MLRACKLWGGVWGLHRPTNLCIHSVLTARISSFTGLCCGVFSRAVNQATVHSLCTRSAPNYQYIQNLESPPIQPNAEHGTKRAQVRYTIPTRLPHFQGQVNILQMAANLLTPELQKKAANMVPVCWSRATVIRCANQNQALWDTLSLLSVA